MTSGRGSSSKVASTVRPRNPFSVRTSPRRWPTKVTVASGKSLEDLVGTDEVEGGEALEEHGGDLHGVSFLPAQPAKVKRRR